MTANAKNKERMENRNRIIELLTAVRYTTNDIEKVADEICSLFNVIVPKGTFYCDCVQPSMQKPISETEYECFDCGKEVKQ